MDGLTPPTQATASPAMGIAVSYFTSSIDSSAVTLKIFTSVIGPSGRAKRRSGRTKPRRVGLVISTTTAGLSAPSEA